MSLIILTHRNCAGSRNVCSKYTWRRATRRQFPAQCTPRQPLLFVGSAFSEYMGGGVFMAFQSQWVLSIWLHGDLPPLTLCAFNLRRICTFTLLRWVFRKWDGCMDWIDLAQERDQWRTLVNAVTNLRVPYNAGNLLTRWKTVSFSSRTLLNGVSKGIRCSQASSLSGKRFILLWTTSTPRSFSKLALNWSSIRGIFKKYVEHSYFDD